MISLRDAHEIDVLPLTDLGLRAWRQAVVGVADVDALQANARRAFLHFLSEHWPVVTVAEMDGVLAGWAAREDQDSAISDLWIDPVLQGVGIGSSLLQDVEARIIGAGFEVATTQTHAQNAPAIGFFKKHGYSINWLSTNYSPKLDRNVESIGLTKRLVVDEPFGYGPGI